MSIGLSEFWTRLVQEGFLDAAGCRNLAGDFANDHDGTPAETAVELASYMVKVQQLTRFQAKSLLSDPPGPLRIGDFRIRSDQSPSPLTRWVEVSPIGPDSADSRSGQNAPSGFLLRTTPENPWLDAHRRIQHPALQPIEVHPADPYVAVYSPLPAGQSLAEQIRAGGLPWNARRVCQVGIEIADGLAAMHAPSLVHGGVRADRVWIGNDGRALLLRDPAGPPVTGLGDASSQWLDTDDTPQSYVAPEITSGSGQCTGASDIYSLGCLLYRLASGECPFDGGDVQATLQMHQSYSPPKLVEAIQQGEHGDPLYRIMAYLMAKDPAARFASADQVAAALRAVLPTLDPDPGPAPAATTVEPNTAKLPAVKSNPSKPQSSPPKSKPDLPGKNATAPTKSRKDIASKDSGAAGKPKKPQDTGKPDGNAKTRQAGDAKPATASPASPVRTPAKDSVKDNAKATAKKSAKIAAGVAASESGPTDAAIPATADVPSDDSKQVSAPETAGRPDQTVAPADDPVGSAIADSGQASDAAPMRTVRRRRKKKSKAPLVLTGLTVIVLMLFVALLVTDPSPPVAKKRQRPTIPAVIPSVSNRSTMLSDEPDPGRSSPASPVGGSQEESADPAYQLVDDDRLLFASPYPPGSDQAPLELLPPGPAAIVSVRLASLRESNGGKQLMATLAPEINALIDAAVARAKVPVDWIDRCTVGLFPGQQGVPDWSLAIELTAPQPMDDLVDRWKVSAAQTRDGTTVYAGDAVGADAFFVNPLEVESKSVTRFAVGGLDRITEVASIDGEPIPLARSLQSLWKGSSADADLVALVTPNFLFADGRAMLDQSAPQLVQSIKSVLIPDVSAVLLVMDSVDEQVFAELRLTPSGGISEATLMRNLRDSINQWPQWADQFVIDAVPDPSWRLLASRLPMMMRYVSDRFRFGISNNVIVANTYVPASPLSQVALATLLAANTPLSAPTVATTPQEALSIDQMLDRKMSVSFDQESLEFAIDVIVAEYARSLPEGSQLPPVRIVGGDLQKAGITQNQQVRKFAKSDLPLRTVLTDLVLGANPDKTATGPDDPKQALIWVVHSDPDAAEKTEILVTTRAAAEGKYELPTEFVAKP
ncbi:Serine/threonine-protein kinase pkn5 [Rubripirellula lacrimiformis]|uniref:Serine/threonine-protein kinase pkn5 n=1 Tax=Rubripirellula lacrimiformis TaxID=1930273 RepID=A0A517N579_9BACT|nr:protein kinase [Rubripirellula lacrimiformis]QDT02290.1 Serine/threonine-protein kinase pkn5 [Rubripirellula lacrimiformis]